MSGSPCGNRKRKRSESTEPECPHSQQSSLLPPFELSPSPHESFSDQTPVTPTALPLTRENLRAHDPTMAPSTPSAAAKSGKASNSMPDNPLEMENLLRANGIVLQESTTNPRLNQLREMAQEKLLGQRHSAMKDDELEVIRQKIEIHRLDNEVTFFNVFWSKLVKDTRSMKDDNGTWSEKTFDSEGILGIGDSNFHANALSELKNVTAGDRVLLERFPKLKTPKPDLAYGFERKSFSDEEEAVIRAYVDHFQICPYRVATFFIVECKGAQGNIQVAQLQASRGAAALVRANRRLNEHAGLVEPTIEGEVQYDRNCAISLSLDQRSASMSVHWVETTPARGDIYHAHLLKEYFYSRDAEIKDLRRDINNVLDWGALTRRKQVEELIQALRGKQVLLSLKEEAASESSKKRKLSRDQTLQSVGESAGQAGAA